MTNVDDHADAETGVPGLRSWTGVYVFVLVFFALIVAALAYFTHVYRPQP